jgi:hypothetical protein
VPPPRASPPAAGTITQRSLIMSFTAPTSPSRRNSNCPARRTRRTLATRAVPAFVPARLERCADVELVGPLHDLLWRFEEVYAVVRPQLFDGLPAYVGVRLVPYSHVAVGQLFGLFRGFLLQRGRPCAALP